MNDEAEGRRTLRIVARIAIGILLLLLVALAAAWIFRKPIASRLIERELEARGVQATYRITRLGLRTQRLENVVIGDPRRPDLTARWAEVLIAPRWGGTTVTRITARGVRINAAIRGGKLRLGQIDRLLPPPSGQPFVLPTFAVDIDDTHIRLATPAGPVGLALRGRGRLSDGFRGTLAASAPRFAPRAGCVAREVHALVDVAIDKRSPRVTGPVDARGVECPRSEVRAIAPRVIVDARLPEALNRWRGEARVAMTSLDVARGALGAVSGRMRFEGDAASTLGPLTIVAQRARFADHAGDRLRFDGRYQVRAREERLGLLGDLALDDLRIGAGLRDRLSRPMRAADKTPLEPLGRAAAAALTRAMASVDLRGRLKLVHGPRGGGARMVNLTAASASGARLRIAGGEGLSYYWPDGKMRIDGEAALAGGGLPSALLAFDQARPGAPIDGMLRIAPYAAGGSRLALAPVRFKSSPDGALAIATVATLDGGFNDGRVEGLVMPIDGRVEASGGFAFNRRCIEARWRSFQVAGLRLGPARLPLCPTGTGLIYRRGRGPVIAGAAIRAPRFSGRLGSTPISIVAAGARFRSQGGAFSVQDARVRLGTPASMSALDLETFAGRIVRGGASGRFSGAAGDIGNVPLLLSGGSGEWSVRDGDLSVGGSLRVADAAASPRFFPLRADKVRLNLADNRVTATAILGHPESGTRVSDVTIAHNLASGSGSAVLAVPGIAFTESFQPEALTRLTTGVVALVRGTVRGEGLIEWTRDRVTSRGTFSTEKMDLAANFGPVEGLTTSINFTDLLGLQTAPGQVANIDVIRTGIDVFDGNIRYQLLPGQRVRVEGGRWPYSGGELALEETILDFSRPSPKALTFRVIGLDAANFVQLFEFSNISATGTFDGVIPMVFDDRGGRIVGGHLEARRQGGTLSYIGELTDKDLGTYGKLAFDALKSLRYSKLSIGLDGSLDGEFVSRIELDGIARDPALTTAPAARGISGIVAGRALGQLAKIPFEFNITVRGPFRTLLATARSLEDPSLLIQSALPEKLRGAPATNPVQPKESEVVQ